MEIDIQICVNCRNPFKEKKSGYLRFSLSCRLGNSGLSVREGLNNLLPESAFTTPDVKRKGEKFLCSECYQLLNKAVVGKSAEAELFSRTAVGSYVEDKKRKTLSSTPSKSPYRGKRRKVDVSTSPFPDKSTASGSGSMVTRVGKIKSWKNRARELITISRFKTLILLLYRSSPKAAKDIEDAIHTLVKREVAGFALYNRVLNQQVTLENIQNFNWGSVLHEFVDHLPVLFNAVAAAGSKEQVTTLLTDKTILSRPGLGNIISTALFIRNRQRYKFLAALNAVAMWRNGGSHKLFQCFNHLGVTLGVDAARNTVDSLREAYDDMILDWKTQIEETLCEKDMHKSVSRSLKFDEDEAEDIDVDMVSTNNEAAPPGYIFCWDNVQIEAHARHQTTEKQNKVHLWALAFAVENRVRTTQLENLAEETQLVDARKIAMSCFLPSEDDWLLLKERMVIIVKRILCQNFAFLQEGLGTVVPLHIKHKHSSVMNKKSNIVNLGVIETNPSSTEGVIRILDTLQKYVPRHPNDAPFKSVCFGDGLSVERMVDAKKSRATGVDEWERMEMFEPSPQEFHKRMINMQDTFNEFFSGRSAGDRGTMYHIKNTFNRRNVKKSVKDAFNHNSNFLRFITEGYVCLFASTLMSYTMDETEVNMSEEEKYQMLQQVATDIVEKVWHQVPGESILEVITAKITSLDTDDADDDDEETDKDHFKFCCNEDTGSNMLECSNPNCPAGQWFHFDCKGIADVPEGDWWCCQECCETKTSIYCVCKKLRPDLEMKRCARKENFTRGEWFHKTCVKLDIGSKPSGTRWFCSLTCKKGSKPKRTLKPEKDDHVYKYSCALTWRGLCDLVKRDAVREGDGEAMICYWRIDMTEFWSKNHYKYLILGHRLLAGVNGWLPKRLAEDIKSNRTANLQGREGTNLELDLVNEFLNNDFKENLKHSRGMYTHVCSNRWIPWQGN